LTKWVEKDAIMMLEMQTKIDELEKANKKMKQEVEKSLKQGIVTMMQNAHKK